MYDIYWFFLVQQVRSVALASAFAFIAAAAVNALQPNLYTLARLAIAGVFAFAWPRVLATPMLNFQWLATLPLSRIDLMFTRVGIVLTGSILMSAGGLLTNLLFTLIIPPPPLSLKAAAAAAKIIQPLPQQESPIPVEAVFGGNMLYLLVFTLVLLAFGVTLMSVSSMVAGTPSKAPRLSGIPWWNPDKRIRYAHWVALIAPPLLIAFLTPAAKAPAIAAVNFALVIAWLVVCGCIYAAITARIPTEGRRTLLFWVGAAHLGLVTLTISLSYALNG